MCDQVIMVNLILLRSLVKLDDVPLLVPGEGGDDHPLVPVLHQLGLCGAGLPLVLCQFPVVRGVASHRFGLDGSLRDNSPVFVNLLIIATQEGIITPLKDTINCC